MKSTKNQLPQSIEKFLSWVCKDDLLEEILGDLQEYQEELTDKPNWKKWIFYWFQAIHFLRPFALKKVASYSSYNRIPMFKNYYKTSFRSLMRNPLSSFINIFGLSVAIGICLVVYAFFEYDYSVDRFHKNKDEVYLITSHTNRDGTDQQFGLTPTPLGEMMHNDFSQIEKMCRIEDGNVVMKHGDNVFHEQVRFADHEFLEMFTFPLKWGTAGSLSDVSSIILSEEMSIKYFGETNPVGKDILMIFGENRSKAFKVVGVSEAFPEAHIIDFDFLVNFENFKLSDTSFDLNDWSTFVNATLIQVDNPTQINSIKQRMVKYKALQNEVEKDWAISSFDFVQLHDLHLKSGKIKDDISYDASAEGRIALPIIALFMLALACFNYINMAVVSAAKRLREIGVRKVMGAYKRLIVIQFLTENILVTLFALVMGIFLAVTIFIPWFSGIADRALGLQLLDGNLWIFSLLLLLFTGIVSGLYPAFYISRFEAVTIFKGSVKFGKKNSLTKILLGTQLVLACISVTGGVVFTQNTIYQSTRSWGYAPTDALYMEVPNYAAYEQMKTVMFQNPNVLSLSGSSQHLGKSLTTTMVHLANQQYEVEQLSADAHYLQTMGLQLKQGRFFKENYESDKQAIVVNELLVKNLVLKQPIGQLFEIDSIKYEVIGVVQDFHNYSFYTPVKPTIIKVASEEEYQYLSIKMRKGTEKNTFQAAQTEWSKLFPEIPFQGGYQEDVWGDYFESLADMESFNKAIAFIAVLLASLGLYGLVTLDVAGRMREFSIRKTLGAKVKNIAANITQQYLLLTVIAFIIGMPLSFFLVQAELALVFAYAKPISYLDLTLSVVILLISLLAVIFIQIRKVSKTNLVEGLKVE
ncbi:MAG: ABC transporter permease [Bacteroidota bacterium]